MLVNNMLPEILCVSFAVQRKDLINKPRFSEWEMELSIMAPAALQTVGCASNLEAAITSQMHTFVLVQIYVPQ